MKKENPILIGFVLFVLIVLTAVATAVKPVNELTANDFAELKIETTKQGSGDRVSKADDKLIVHYTGTLKDGTQFDTSKGSEPIEFILGNDNIIDGWHQGMVGMKKGEVRRLEIPSSLGYGEQSKETIPANSGLVFEVELVDFGK